MYVVWCGFLIHLQFFIITQYFARIFIMLAAANVFVVVVVIFALVICICFTKVCIRLSAPHMALCSSTLLLHSHGRAPSGNGTVIDEFI